MRRDPATGDTIRALVNRWCCFGRHPRFTSDALADAPRGVELVLGWIVPETFAFLGFTHICGRTREGRRLIRRHTVRERLNAKLKRVKATLRRMMHLAIPEQGGSLRLVLNGFCNSYAVPTNFRALNSSYWHTVRSWQHCLRRRSQRHRLT